MVSAALARAVAGGWHLFCGVTDSMEFALVSLLLVLLVAWLAGFVANRFGFPAILGELAAGVLIGPAILGAIILDPSIPLVGGLRLGFPEHVPGLDVLAEVGVFLLLLYIGMEVDFRDLVKAGKAGLWAATGGFLVPAVMGYAMSSLFGVSREGALFLGLAMGVTSIATKSRILVDLKLFGTRIANVLLAGALISDTAVLMIFALVLGLLGPEELKVTTIGLVVVKAALFFAIATVVGLKLLPLVGDFLQRIGLKDRTGNFTLVLLIGLVYAEMAHLLGLHSIIGAFMGGLFLREGVLRGRLSHEITVLVRDLSVGFLTPIFFVTAGFSVTLGVLVTHSWLVVLVLVVATVGKILGTALFYAIGRLDWREGIVIGFGMNGRGAVEIIIAELALSMGLITREIFSVLVLMAFFTTMTVPVFLKWGTNWLRSRGELARSEERRRGVILVGATPLAREFAREVASRGESVVLVDSNRNRCEAASREGLQVISGNALSEEVLAIAGAKQARRLIAITPNAEVNTVAVRTAHESFGVPRAESVIPLAVEGEPPSPGAFLLSQPERLERWNYLIVRKEYERLVLKPAESEPLPEFLKRHAGDPARILPLAVVRQDQLLLPGEVEKVGSEDLVIVLRQSERRETEESRFDATLRQCPILDIEDSLSMEELFDRVASTMSARLNLKAAPIKQRLLEREHESSTLIIPGLAIPHVEIEGTDRFDMLVARCREGVQFGSGGAESAAHMVFVLLGSRDARNHHLRALSAVAQLVQNPDFERRWDEARDTEALRRVLLRARGLSA